MSNYLTMSNKYYDTALNLVKEAGEIVRNASAKKKTVQMKSSDIDLVTETDQLVEQILIGRLQAEFPDHKFIGEESIANGAQCILTDSPTWIIDPIDGTMNFIHGFPNFCISIALLVNKVIEIGIVYNPLLDKLFTAQKNKGAFLNGKAIKVSQEVELEKALLVVEFGTSKNPEKMKNVMENFQKITPIVHGIRSMGSAALNMAMVAMGAADANFEFGIHAWDIAAGILIVEEAGGIVLDPSGGPLDLMSRRVLCASSKELAIKLSENLVQFYPEPRD
ncbi:inositol monophosphatase 1 isoform X2 [Ctenocephalides felis]|uniref:inositol monophosphatase 1 isoform X2 n=1 Tax=Ctenocephalides felis TaxID=7515 RepID=UPI000E6E403B|nr:inositol monophosphatase 1 isoform X2 [Ctenocephalides felis]